MNEFDLLRRIYARNAELAPRVLVPPGDDMALLRVVSPQGILAGVDQLVEGRHYDRDRTPVDLVGRKAVTRSLSDIAAMAGRPLASLVAVTLPADYGEERALALFEAMRITAARFDCPLVGGDLGIHGDRSHPLVCAVTVLAEPSTPRPLTRGAARVGDEVYVTGHLGGSYRSGRHLTFDPRIREALALAELLGERLHAMIDISDGLGRDAGHIAEQSGVRIEIDAARVPTTPGSDWRSAMTDGEDYELCFTASGDVPQEVEGLEITRIGRVLGGASD